MVITDVQRTDVFDHHRVMYILERKSYGIDRYINS